MGLVDILKGICKKKAIVPVLAISMALGAGALEHANATTVNVSIINGPSAYTVKVGVDEVNTKTRICTPFKSENVTGISFPDDWIVAPDGNYCYVGDTGGNSVFDLSPGENHAFNVSLTGVNPETLIALNGTTPVGGNYVDGDFIYGADGDFTYDAPNPNSTDTISVIGEGGKVIANDVDTSAGDNIGSRYLTETKTYTAVANEGYNVTWDANTCDVVNGIECTNNTIGPHNPTVTFVAIPPTQYTFAATIIDGGGNLISTPAGIDTANGANTADFEEGTTVTLQANPASEHHLASWGDACTGTGACQVTVNSDLNVSADFDINQYEIAVAVSGDGKGIVTGNGFDTGSGDNSEVFDYGTTVILYAQEADNSKFLGWSEAGCPGTDPCEVTADQAKTIVATFDTTLQPQVAPKSSIMTLLPAILTATQNSQ